MQNAGCSLYRYDMDFENINAQHDHLITMLTARGITPYLMLGSTGALWNVPNQSTYVTACQTVAASLPNGSYIEVWNEPNIGQFWNNAIDASTYAALVSAAYTAIKGVNGTLKVAAGALAYNVASFRQAFLAAAPSLDAYSFHPYTVSQGNPDQLADTTHSFVRCIDDTIVDLKAAGYGTKEMIISEFGWACAGSSAASDGISAVYHARAVEICIRYQQIHGLIGYHVGDRTVAGAEPTTSMLDVNQTPTDTWRAFFGHILQTPDGKIT